MPEETNEKILVTRLNKDDVIAFDTLFSLYGNKLYGFAFKYLKSKSESEELVQEVFVRIWENRASIQSGYSFKSYLFKIALNQIRKFFNRRKTMLECMAQLKEEQTEEDNHTTDIIDYGSVLELIDEVIQQLPERKREIFLLSRKEGLSSKEIAEKLNIVVGTVDNQVSDALRIIRKKLSNENLAFLLFYTLFL